MNKSKRIKNAAAMGMLITGLILIAAGVFAGEVQVILQKAVIICLECIGIG